MKLIIDIPSTDIPKKQDIIDIKVHFISGQVCACDFPFEVVDQEQYYKDLAESYEKTIRKLKKAILEQEPKTGWILVSERLPDESGEYLVTYNGIATTLDYSDKYGWYYDDGEHFTQFEDDVIAWMPLPEPYKEG